MLTLTKYLMIVSSVIAITFIGPVLAHKASNTDGKNHINNRIIKKLDLNDNQMVQVTALFANMKNQSTNRQDQAEQLRALIDAGNVNQAADMAANNPRDKVIKLAANQESLKTILTEEQLIELAELQDNRKGRVNRRNASRSQ